MNNAHWKMSSSLHINDYKIETTPL